MTRINTNVESLIARRALTENNSSLNQSLARLSTGLRINSGRDDPAGLIASEGLRGSIVGISSAIDNATRADTIMSVAEGGLQEISSLLLEVEALVDRTASEAGLTSNEIAANQSQIDAILRSINRIAESTAFGDKKLLNGNFDFTTSGVNVTEATGATVDQIDNVQVNAADIAEGSYRQVNATVVTASTLAIVSAVGTGTDGGGLLNIVRSAVTLQIQGTLGTEILSFASGTTTTEMKTAINGSKELTGVSATASAATGGATALVMQSTTFGSDAFVSVAILDNTTALTIGGETARGDGTDGTVTVDGANATVKGLDASVRIGSLDLDLTMSSAFGSTAGGTATFEITGGGALFSISPTVGLAGQETIGITQATTANLGTQANGYLSTLGTGSTNALSSRNYATAQRVVKDSISQIAKLRGRIGAFQKNTLQTTINSLRVAQENVTAAESAIRDADFAAETSNLTRAQILVNSSTLTLQMANAQPQSALQLLG